MKTTTKRERGSTGEQEGTSRVVVHLCLGFFCRTLCRTDSGNAPRLPRASRLGRLRKDGVPSKKISWTVSHSSRGQAACSGVPPTAGGGEKGDRAAENKRRSGSEGEYQFYRGRITAGVVAASKDLLKASKDAESKGAQRQQDRSLGRRRVPQTRLTLLRKSMV